ncbi:MAG TPA: prepilin-type N-terminal cleavage/methylation domain-containing protein [Acidimicrobiales bacterium]|nr:prepilin-type N-terminal cleavage/methylation domain-containing protein [Acidimicrobiales bacterium]
MHPNRAHAPAVCATDPFAACHAQEQGRSVFGSWPESPTDAGFTLIELMVVLLILAILLAIAIPTFLGVTGGANDKAAQSNLNTALTTAKTAETQANQSYSTVTAASLQSNEPSLSFVTGGTSTQGQISVYVSTDGNGIVLASPSKNNSRCWYVVDNIAVVAGNATTNGGYVDTTAGGIAGSTTSAPTKAGTFYGMAKGTCNPSVNTFPTGAGNTPVWASSFTGA